MSKGNIMSKPTPLFTRERIRLIVFNQFLAPSSEKSRDPDSLFLARKEYQRRLELAGLPLDDFFDSDIEQMLDSRIDEAKKEFVVKPGSLNEETVQALNDEALLANEDVMQDVNSLLEADDTCGKGSKALETLSLKLSKLTALVDAVTDGIADLCEQEIDRLEDVDFLAYAAQDYAKEVKQDVECLVEQSRSWNDVCMDEISLMVGELTALVSAVQKGVDNWLQLPEEKRCRISWLADVTLDSAKKTEHEAMLLFG